MHSEMALYFGAGDEDEVGPPGKSGSKVNKNTICTASKMELRRMRRRMSRKAPKKAPRTASTRTAPRMAQGWLNTCGIAMPLHDKAIYLQWCNLYLQWCNFYLTPQWSNPK